MLPTTTIDLQGDTAIIPSHAWHRSIVKETSAQITCKAVFFFALLEQGVRSLMAPDQFGLKTACPTGKDLVKVP